MRIRAWGRVGARVRVKVGARVRVSRERLAVVEDHAKHDGEEREDGVARDLH